MLRNLQKKTDINLHTHIILYAQSKVLKTKPISKLRSMQNNEKSPCPNYIALCVVGGETGPPCDRSRCVLEHPNETTYLHFIVIKTNRKQGVPQGTILGPTLNF
ncbi:hypothetical protein B5X24_HaOG210665 [Helicoverpa armigera]|nr:hypothetical protein B5X24_HaOG210665 [Helicoverpa armigera]